jgi:phosphate transport system permease protein
MQNINLIVSRYRPTNQFQRFRRYKSSFISTLLGLATLIVVTPLFLVLFFLIKEGASSLNLDFFTHIPKPTGELGGGMANAILGSITLMGIACILGVPVGVLGGVYLSEYGSTKVNYWIRFFADILNGVPSIVWGMVVYSILVVPFKTFSAYAGGIALGLIMIPLIIRNTEEVLVLVPQSFREAGLALGIPRWRIVFSIILKTATKGIVTGILVAIARISGETAPLLFTAFGNSFWNHNLAQPIAALPLQIYAYAISPYEDLHHQAWAGALVLMLLILTLNIIVRFLSRDIARNSSYERN